MADGESAYSVILFHTNSAALRAEKILLREGFAIKLIPVPRQLSSDCGIALRFDRSRETRVGEVLEAAGVPIDSIHVLE
ncbi:MAG: DUF3343 domain-containing protein [Acidobacteriota bacterium]|jgi:hypothetical protein|nr:DUF3343 domain-containing protein [Acidobacteriota bacterium]